MLPFIETAERAEYESECSFTQIFETLVGTILKRYWETGGSNNNVIYTEKDNRKKSCVRFGF